MLHRISFILSVIAAVIGFFCLILPEWVHANVHLKDENRLQGMTAGVFFSCSVGDGSLRWVDCYRSRYMFMSWYMLVQALYTLAVMLLIASVPVHYIAFRPLKANRTTIYRAAPTSLAFVALGFQVVVLGIYGDHYDSQSWCILRYPDQQRELCTDVLNYHGETVRLGWTYWIALVAALVSAINSLLDYLILNDEVEIS